MIYKVLTLESREVRCIQPGLKVQNFDVGCRHMNLSWKAVCLNTAKFLPIVMKYMLRADIFTSACDNYVS